MAEFRNWRNSNRTPLKDVVPLDTPYNLYIETSAVCNARCVYCTQSASPQTGIMSMDLFHTIMEQAHGFPSKIKIFDMFYSGEPLCNPNFANMVEQAKKENLAEQIGVTTNGLLLTPEKIDEIIDAGIDVIRISIQGLDAEKYKKICGVNVDFEKFVSVLSYLYAHRKNCKVRMKIVDLAIKDIPNGEEKFKKLFGSISDSVFVEHIIPIYNNIEYDSLDKKISKRAKDGRYGMSQEEIHKVCYRPFIKLLVATNGDITAACCNHPAKDVVFGNIKNENIVDVWNGNIRQEFLKMQLLGKRFGHPFCKDCLVPNDVAYKEDLLDPYVDEILQRI